LSRKSPPLPDLNRRDARNAEEAGYNTGGHRLGVFESSVKEARSIDTDMAYTTLELRFEDGIATITLNRPDKRNAISNEMIEEIPAVLGEVEASKARVAILTGAGKAFCAGMDLESLRAIASQSHSQNLEDSRRMAQMFHRVYSFPKPLIAAVNGAAIAGGSGLATLADFTLAVPDAKFGYTEVRIGFLPAVVSVFLLRQIGEKRTRELLLTGRLFEAEEARAMGLVTQIVAPEKLLETARHLAHSLIAFSPTSLSRTKRLLLRWNEKEIERDLEIAIEESANIRRTADFREGLSAFLEKREPKWSGE
jgi:methylglutaconyl-CoA hydratase